MLSMSTPYKRRVSEKYEDFRPVKKGEIGYGRRWYVNEKTGERITYRQFIESSHIEYGKKKGKHITYGPYDSLGEILTDTTLPKDGIYVIQAYGIANKDGKRDSLKKSQRIYMTLTSLLGGTDTMRHVILEASTKDYDKIRDREAIRLLDNMAIFDKIEKFYVIQFLQ